MIVNILPLEFEEKRRALLADVYAFLLAKRRARLLQTEPVTVESLALETEEQDQQQ